MCSGLKKIMMFFSLVIFSLSLVDAASAWGPTTHLYLVTSAYQQDHTGELGFCMTNYPKEYEAGNEIPDISVVYYYTSSGTYRATHNWDFYTAVLNSVTQVNGGDAERCFAEGIASHYGGDYISHTIFVPNAIKSTGLPNSIIHWMVEAKVESVVITQYPQLYATEKCVFDITLPTNEQSCQGYAAYNPKLLQMIQIALGQNAPLNVHYETLRLSACVQNFYDCAFVLPPQYRFFGDQNGIAKFIAGGSSLSDYSGILSQAMQEIIYLNSQQGSLMSNRASISPNGFVELSTADAAANTTRIYWVIGAAALVLIFLFANSKRKRR